MSNNPAAAALAVEFGDLLIEAESIDDTADVYQRVPWISPARLGALLGLEQTYLVLADSHRAMQYAEQVSTLAPRNHAQLIGVIPEAVRQP